MYYFGKENFEGRYSREASEKITGNKVKRISEPLFYLSPKELGQT